LEIKNNVRFVRLILDNHCTQGEHSSVIQHINECPDCFEQYEVETYIRFLFKTKLSKKSIPINFASQIRDKIISKA
jgi:anti-sigma factor (TIGR02949 family)